MVSIGRKFRLVAHWTVWTQEQRRAQQYFEGDTGPGPEMVMRVMCASRHAVVDEFAAHRPPTCLQPASTVQHSK